MAQKVNAPRGMRDFLPADKAKREHALSIIRSVYRRHGFDEIEAPVVEDYDRLHAGLGGDNEKLSFSILKRGIRPEHLQRAAEENNAEVLADLGLRFDLTVPLARFYASNAAELPSVFRAVHIGPVWRAERPQKGRYRQFVQADIDIIGEESLLAETELIAATSEALSTLGLQDCVIRVNDRRLLLGLLSFCGFDEADAGKALISIDKLDKIGTAGVTAELAEFAPEAASRLSMVLSQVEPKLAGGGIALSAEIIREVMPQGASEDAVASLSELAAALEGALPDGVRLVFDPTLVRGMGYYTGTIYEISHPGSGSSVGGGGRYDGMIGRFLQREVPAVGFSIGFERIIDLIDFDSAAAEKSVALIYDADVRAGSLQRLKRELMAEGARVQLAKRQKNMKALFATLEGAGFTHAANVNTESRSVADLHIRELGSEK